MKLGRSESHNRCNPTTETEKSERRDIPVIEYEVGCFRFQWFN